VPTAQDQRGLADTVRMAELAIADFTSLPFPTDVAEVGAVRRAQWVEANVSALPPLLDPVAVKLAEAMQDLHGGTDPMPAGMEGSAELLQMVMGRMVPLLFGAQVGSALGYLGQRVLGQYDLALPRPTGSVLFVVPNIARFEREWSLEPREFRAWVALHEVTHRFEFAQPWVRVHFVRLVTDLVEHAEVDLSSLERRLEGMDISNPEALADLTEGMGNLFGEASDGEQRLRIARVQAFMAAAEGYGDHVMEGLGRKMLTSVSQIEEALRRFREGRPADRALEQLLGLEMKIEQYRQGKEFCARVSELTDEATLARMWGSPDSLPSMPELEEPTLWLARMA